MPPRDLPGLLLVNLGTPDAPHPAAVRRYLREFLSDPRVLDLPAALRWLVLNLFILPLRPRRSARAYAKIWSERGSPLVFHGLDLAAKVQSRLGAAAVVRLAMRYGRPSIAEAIDGFHREGVRRLVVFPLYPQHSAAATGSSIERVFAEASRRWNVPYLHVVPPFFDDPRYIAAMAESAAPLLREVDPELVFFSFHGLPQSQIRKSDRRGGYCLAAADCCARAAVENPGALGDCYRAQCLTTARLLADALGVPPERRLVCFQSRFSPRWIRPFTDVEIRAAARRGVKRALVISAAFVADCLETIEEIGLRAADDWRANGGDTLRLVPSLNARDAWAEAVVAIARDASRWLAER
ncbi:MAG: ferrochelatase [Deltaproteobacteria bacterium]|nr:ferrochelatase [Deltaproteobacteria bacterium]